MHSIGKSGFGFSNPDFRFPNIHSDNTFSSTAIKENHVTIIFPPANSYVCRLQFQPEEKSRRGVGGGTPYNGLYGEAPPETGFFCRLKAYRRVGISRAGVYKRIGKTVILVFKRAFQNISKRPTKQLIHSRILRAYSSKQLRKRGA